MCGRRLESLTHECGMEFCQKTYCATFVPGLACGQAQCRRVRLGAVGMAHHFCGSVRGCSRITWIPHRTVYQPHSLKLFVAPDAVRKIGRSPLRRL
jgi:hypothetical protein